MVDRELLRTSLSAAVPFWALEMQSWPYSRVMQAAQEGSQVVAEKGDVIMFRGHRKGETAQAFNALARGIAALSFSPGGVRFMDLHFENHHPDS